MQSLGYTSVLCSYVRTSGWSLIKFLAQWRERETERPPSGERKAVDVLLSGLAGVGVWEVGKMISTGDLRKYLHAQNREQKDLLGALVWLWSLRIAEDSAQAQ